MKSAGIFQSALHVQLYIKKWISPLKTWPEVNAPSWAQEEQRSLTLGFYSEMCHIHITTYPPPHMWNAIIHAYVGQFGRSLTWVSCALLYTLPALPQGSLSEPQEGKTHRQLSLQRAGFQQQVDLLQLHAAGKKELHVTKTKFVSKILLRNKL